LRSERVSQSAQVWRLPPEAVLASRWEKPSASVAAQAQQQGAAASVLDAAQVQQREAAAWVLDAVGVRQPEVAAASDAGEEPQPAAAQPEVSDAEAVPLPAGARVAVWGAAAAPRLAVRAASVASQPAAARPSAAPWVFRRDRVLPWPVRRRAARSAHAMRTSQAASR
jgi:hypothetical protein